MSRARRAATQFLGLGRIVLAVALLAGVWIGTVNAVERGSRDAEQRRSSDRIAITKGFASSVDDWLDAGRTEAASLGRVVGASQASGAGGGIDAFLSRPRAFSRDAIVFSAGTVVAATGRYGALVGLRPKACVRAGEVAPNELDPLVRTAGPTAVVSPIFDVPGSCRPGVAVAVRAGPFVAVVLGDVDDVTARLVAGARITGVASLSGSSRPTGVSPGGTRMLLVTPGLSVDPSAGVVTPPSYIAAFATDVAADGAQIRREASSSRGDAAVVSALAPVSSGWSVVLEQDAAVFDIPLQDRPAVVVSTVLTVVFAAVFALIAFFDVRRRRAHRRAEVAKNAFFSIAGHELRTPLTVLNGFADMLSTNWTDLDDARRRSLVDRMVPQAQRLGRLVERLLVAASIQAETHTRPQIQEVDPAPLVKGVAAEFRPEAPIHSFVVDAPTGTVVLADPAMLEEILRHLVENAVKYSPSGGTIWLHLAGDSNFVHIVVDDEGIGLPSDYRRIFDRFVQGESVTTRVHDEGGVGLGLYIVRTLVEEMGGSVRAEPLARGGARFIVSLKRRHDTRASAQANAPNGELVTSVQPARSRTRQKA